MEAEVVVAMSVVRQAAPLGKEYVLQLSHVDRLGIAQVSRFRLEPAQVATLIRLCCEART